MACATEMTIDTFLAAQQELDELRLITCGSVDDGKSTLIGRILWESHRILDDQLIALQRDSEQHGTQGKSMDLALLVDGLTAEREQGITIDVAYRYFATDRRRFIVADTPGHEQYTRNMVTGASTARLAVILIDARKGVLTQTRRHAFLTALLGIRHVVLAVNKMDLVAYDEGVFRKIRSDFEEFSRALGLLSMTAIPVSALVGDNITTTSGAMPWYEGQTLLGFLETVDVGRRDPDRFVFPVQWVNRPNPDFRGYAGTVAQGEVRPADELRIAHSGRTARVQSLLTMDGPLEVATAGQSITITLDADVDASRGDVLTLASEPLQTSDQFEVDLVWLENEAGLIGRTYDIKLATQWASASLTSIKHVIDVDTLAKGAGQSLRMNDICLCTIASSRQLVFASFHESETMGSFILVDRLTHATAAAGLIRHSLRRAANVHRQPVSIARLDRERLNGHRAKVVWFTGLSGAGKSTIANALEVALHERGFRTYLLDADNIRQGLNRDLGFTEADRVENIRRAAELSKLMMDAGLIVLTAFISPFRREREVARELIGAESFVEVFVSTPLEVCRERDVKGLYRKAAEGSLPNLTGVGSRYEVPQTPDYVANTSGQELESIVSDLCAYVVGD